jgi:hypothetical protein
MRTLACALAIALLGTGTAARADCGSAPECLARLGIPRIDPVVAAVAGAVAAPIILFGGAATMLKFAAERPAPTGVVRKPDETGRRRPQLELIPTPKRVGTDPAPYDGTRPMDPALRFNDAATTALIAVGGVAMAASIVAGIAKKH